MSVVDLNTADRQFVFDLIDKVKGYGNHPALNPGSTGDSGDGGTD